MKGQPDLFGVAPSRVTLTPWQAEHQRRENNYTRVLVRLRQGPATNHELAEIAGYRFGARLGEIRDHGGDFAKTQTGDAFVYRLTKEPTR